MSEMIERVARAICGVDREPGAYDEISDHARGILRREARAAIEAMREPTEAMVEALAFEYRGITQRDRFPSYWRAAIDEALE